VMHGSAPMGIIFVGFRAFDQKHTWKDFILTTPIVCYCVCLSVCVCVCV
jgi:hypothetical protein